MKKHLVLIIADKFISFELRSEDGSMKRFGSQPHDGTLQDAKQACIYIQKILEFDSVELIFA